MSNPHTLQKIEALIAEISDLKTQRHSDPGPTRWKLVVEAVLAQALGTHSMVYQNFMHLPWYEKMATFYPGEHVHAQINAHHQRAYVQAMDQAQGVLEAALVLLQPSTPYALLTQDRFEEATCQFVSRLNDKNQRLSPLLPELLLFARRYQLPQLASVCLKELQGYSSTEGPELEAEIAREGHPRHVTMIGRTEPIEHLFSHQMPTDHELMGYFRQEPETVICQHFISDRLPFIEAQAEGAEARNLDFLDAVARQAVQAEADSEAIVFLYVLSSVWGQILNRLRARLARLLLETLEQSVPEEVPLKGEMLVPKMSFLSLSERELRRLVCEAFAHCLRLAPEGLACEIVEKESAVEYRLTARVKITRLSQAQISEAEAPSLDALPPSAIRDTLAQVFARVLQLDPEDVICTLRAGRASNAHVLEQAFELSYLPEAEGGSNNLFQRRG